MLKKETSCLAEAFIKWHYLYKNKVPFTMPSIICEILIFHKNIKAIYLACNYLKKTKKGELEQGSICQRGFKFILVLFNEKG